MMKNDNIRIKKKEAGFFLFGFASLLAVLLGIFLIALPFLMKLEGSALLLFPVMGAVVTVIGGILFTFVVYRGLKPKDALIITNKGFTNCLLGGKDGVYVEWVNVTSMKIFGLAKSPMLGLSLADNDAYLATLHGSALKDARANLDLGLPIIAISQREVFLPIGDLKNLFSRMIKGAISWEHYSAQGKKADEVPSKAEETPVTPAPADQHREKSEEQSVPKTEKYPFEKTRAVESEDDPILLADADDEE